MPPIVFDITRLLSRIATATPNGIDRVDLAYANHFLADASQRGDRALAFLLRGPRTIEAPVAARAIASISRNWGEDQVAGEAALQSVLDRLAGRAGQAGRSGEPIRVGRRGRPRELARLLTQIRLFGGSHPAQDAPRNAIYLNVSQFPVWFDPYFRWMDSRPDLKPVFMVHDLLSLEFPEYFPPKERERHQKRLGTLVRRAVAAITSTESVRVRLGPQLASLGRPDMPIHVAHLPVASVFHTERSTIARSEVPYFVVCGTIEPRKNHLLLLHLWRNLVRDMGALAPKLVVVGSRGWENENVVDLLERCPGLREKVVEASGLSTPALKTLFDGARALLMPTFGEGFGLPVAEALAAGLPVVAADIASLREIAGSRATLLHPLDGVGWMREIRVLTSRPREAAISVERAGAGTRSDWSHYFEDLENFLSGL